MALFALSLLFVVLCTFLLRYYWQFRSALQLVEKLPGPPLLPLVGNLFVIRRRPVDWWEQFSTVSELYGDTPRMQRAVLGTKIFVVIGGAEECEAILSTNRHLNKGFLYEFITPWLGRGLLTSQAAKWRPRRKLLTPTFHYDILKDFISYYNHSAKVLLRKIQSKVDKDESKMDVYPLLTLCALDIICESAMGCYIDAQMQEDSDYVKAIKTLNAIISHRQLNPHVWPDFLLHCIGRGKEHDDCLCIIKGFSEKRFYKVIQERLAEREQAKLQNCDGEEEKQNDKQLSHRVAFLDLLLNMADKGQININDVREEVDTFMFEGHDTTATSMSWTLFLLASHPEIQRQVHEELDNIFRDSSTCDFRDLAKMDLLERCLKESLRLYPSVPMVTRQLESDLDIRGFKIPKQTTLLIMPHAVHRDTRHWEDPERFDPDRFLPQNLTGRHPFAYIPFSGGSRNCIGQRFAIMEEKTILSWILRYFKVTAVHKRHQLRAMPELILRPSSGLVLQFAARKSLDFD